MSNSFNSFGPDLGPNSFQRLLADCASICLIYQVLLLVCPFKHFTCQKHFLLMAFRNRLYQDQVQQKVGPYLNSIWFWHTGVFFFFKKATPDINNRKWQHYEDQPTMEVIFYIMYALSLSHSQSKISKWYGKSCIRSYTRIVRTP